MTMNLSGHEIKVENDSSVGKKMVYVAIALALAGTAYCGYSSINNDEKKPAGNSRIEDTTGRKIYPRV